jgi:hypothetical protein
LPGETGNGRSLDWLIGAYFASPAYENLGARARKMGRLNKNGLAHNQQKRRDYLTAFANARTEGGRRFGNGPFHSIKPSHIELWLDSIKPVSRHGVGKGYWKGGISVRDAHLIAVRVLFNWALDKELTTLRNPAARIETTYDCIGHAPWSDADRRKFHKRWPDFDGMPGLAAELAFLIGPRREDLLEFGDHLVEADGVLRWEEGKGSGSQVPGGRSRRKKKVTPKRKATFALHEFPELRARIDAVRKRAERETGVVPFKGGTWLRNTKGRKFTYGNFGHHWRNWCRAAKVTEGLVLHGMRAGMAVTMLESGADLQEISGALNHMNLTTTERYLRGRNVEKLATKGRRVLRSITGAA